MTTPSEAEPSSSVQRDSSPEEAWSDTLRIGGEELQVLSYPADTSDLLAHLTPAEREVARLVLAGCSNREIATSRGTSIGTVSKQLTAIYRKLGVSSRHEVAVAFFGSPEPSAEGEP